MDDHRSLSLRGGGLHSVRIYIGDGRILERGVVRVGLDGNLQGIEAQSDATPIDGLLDASGQTVFPGFIDANTHLTLTGGLDPHGDIDRFDSQELRKKARRFAHQTLLGGVTQVRDLGGIDYLDIELRRAITQGKCLGPNMQAAGKLICCPAGHGHKVGREASGPAELRNAVLEQIERGADVIKLIASGGVLTETTEPGEASLTVDELRAAVDAAHSKHVRVTAHSHGVESTLRSIAAGVDSIEHGVFMDEPCMDALAEAGCPVVSTLCAPSRVAEAGVDSGVPTHVIDRMARILDIHRAAIGKAHARGVRIVMGSDAGSPLNRHGDNLREMRYLYEAGLPFEEVVRSATVYAAELLNVADRAGTLETGKNADMTLFKVDPATCPGRVGDPQLLAGVVLNGHLKTVGDQALGLVGGLVGRVEEMDMAP